MADYDLAVIGGGINGAGIARDAAGRGLRVVLFEQHDLASGTSSASTKLIHGGLRYLEHHAFKLVREALTERLDTVTNRLNAVTDRLDRLISVTTKDRTVSIERIATIETRLARLEERVGI